MGVFQQRASGGKGGGEGFEKAPPGNHPAVLVAIVDMGTQVREYGGEEKAQRRAYFVWELVTEKMSGTKDRNHLVGIDLTVSLNEKAKLRQWIEARVGKKMPEDADYDILKELGKPCLLNVVEKTSAGGKTFPKIEGVAALPKGMPVPAAQHEPFSWSLEDFERVGEIELPAWITELWLYGKPVTEHIMDSVEIQDALRKTQSEKTRKANEDKFVDAMSGTAPAEVEDAPF